MRNSKYFGTTPGHAVLRTVGRLILLLTIQLTSHTFAAGPVQYYFKEIDGSSTHFYDAFCGLGRCRIQGFSFMGARAGCIASLLKPIEGQAISGDGVTYTISTSGGICGYTNTYTLSPTGMIQTKTSKVRYSKELKAAGCQVFSPKTYTALFSEYSDLSFSPAGCTAVRISF